MQINPISKIADLMRRLFRHTDLESTVYPSKERIRLFAFAIIVMHFSFYFIDGASGSYTNFLVSLALCLLCGLLLVHTYHPIFHRISNEQAFDLSMWIHIPVFFLWMYLMTNYDDRWFSRMVTAIVTYFLIHNWRNVMLFYLGALPVAGLAYFYFPGASRLQTLPPVMHLMGWTLAFAIGIIYAANMAVMREGRLRQSLSLVNVVQSTLQNAISNIALLPAKLRRIGNESRRSVSSQRLLTLAQHLDLSVKSMQRYLEIQRKNTILMDISGEMKILSAQTLVESALEDYPYESARAQRCLELRVVSDFNFLGNHEEWQQVIINMLQNAFRVLNRTQLHLEKGDLIIHVQSRANYGRIAIHDSGLGIDKNQLDQIFEPFYTFGPDAGIGLGLAYCRQVVQRTGGKIQVESSLAGGTTFFIYLPQLKAYKHV